MTPEEWKDEHDNVERVTEHGVDWLLCRSCGASASIHKASDPDEYDTWEEAEDVDDGDGSCFDNSRFMQDLNVRSVHGEDADCGVIE